MARNPAKWEGIDLCRGRYCSLEKLGEGGMGFVYKARDKRLGRFVVIKVPRAEMLTSSQFRQRFIRELQSLVKLDHRHIVAIQDYAQEEKIPYAVMQFLPKGDLDDRRSQDPQELKKWLEDIANALDFVHKKGYVHRDVKPGNILFDDEGYAYLSDFGIAKVVADSEDDQQGITQMGFAIGTPEYMAPELAKKNFDGRIDQYALAATVYELLAGEVPFQGETAQETIQFHHFKEAKKISTIPDELNSVILKGMAKDPDTRYPNCSDFADDVLRVLQNKKPLGKFAESPVNETPAKSSSATKNRPRTMVEPVGGGLVGPGPISNPGGGQQRQGTIVEPLPTGGLGGGDSSAGGRDTKKIASSKVDTKKTLVKKHETADPNTQETSKKLDKRFYWIGGGVGLMIVVMLAVLFSGSANTSGMDRIVGKWRWDYKTMLKSSPPGLSSQIRDWQRSGVENTIEFREDGIVVERQVNAVVPSESRSEFTVTNVEDSKIEIKVTAPLSDKSGAWIVEPNKYNTRCVLKKSDGAMQSDIYLRKK